MNEDKNIISQIQFKTFGDILCYYHNINYDIEDTILFVKDSNIYKQRISNKPQKPSNLNLKTSDEFLEYANKLKTYEIDIVSYNEKLKLFNDERSRLDVLIILFIRELSGLNKIPEQYRDKVFSHANDHNYNGYYQTYNNLCDLVEIFN